MGSLQSAQIRQKNAHEHSERIASDDPVALRIRYIGTGSVSSVVVDTDEDITLTSSDGGAEEFLLSTYTTMGALADAINNSEYWSCQLLDALRSDSTTSSPFVDDASVSAENAGYYDALIDTDTFLSITYRCTWDRDKYGDLGAESPKGAHRVHLQEIQYHANVNAASSNGFRIYEYDPTLQSETQIYQADSVDDTDTTVNFASGESTIASNWGNDLIVRVIDDTSLADSGLFLECSYKAE